MSKHTKTIVDFITTFQGNCTTGDIAAALGLSASRTREILAAEIKAGTISRNHVEEDGTKVLVYSVPKAKGKVDHGPSNALIAAAIARDPELASKAKVKNPTKVKAEKTLKKSTGLGNPDAKKSINPQSTLELKKAAVAKIGGKMVWTNKNWSVTKGKYGVEFTSRQLAGMTVDKLITMINS